MRREESARFATRICAARGALSVVCGELVGPVRRAGRSRAASWSVACGEPASPSRGPRGDGHHDDASARAASEAAAASSSSD